MTRHLIFAGLFAGALAVLNAADLGSRAEAAQPDLFYNYYVGPPGVPAQMYLCPRPTPPLVGHTWITYQPLMPHEFMYKHRRNYYKYYRDGSYTQASIRYY